MSGITGLSEQVADLVLNGQVLDLVLAGIRVAMVFVVAGLIVSFLRQMVLYFTIRLLDIMKRYWVVELRDGHQYKLSRMNMRGAYLGTDKEDRLKFIPLSEWGKMEKTVVYQEVAMTKPHTPQRSRARRA